MLEKNNVPTEFQLAAGFRSREWWVAAYALAVHHAHGWASAVEDEGGWLRTSRGEGTSLPGVFLTSLTIWEVGAHLREVESDWVALPGIWPQDQHQTATGRVRWRVDDFEKRITVEIWRPSAARVAAIKAEDEAYDAYVAEAGKHGDDARETKHALTQLEAARAALDRLASDGQCVLRWVAPLEEGAWVPELLKLGPSEARHRKVLASIVQALGRPVPAELASENADEF